MVCRLYLLIYNSNLKRRTGILKGDIRTSQREETREKSFLGEWVHAKPLSEVTASCPARLTRWWLFVGVMKTAILSDCCWRQPHLSTCAVEFGVQPWFWLFSWQKKNPTQVFGVPKWWGRGGEGWEACGRSIPLNDFTELAISEAANRLSDQPHYGCCGFQALLSLWLSLPLRI